jgi:SAM-dependent methyltransferase
MSALEQAPFLDLTRWSRALTAAEYALVERVDGPVLDIGCGPGRFVEALLARGVLALGIDGAPAAIERARSRGLHVMTRSIYDRIPREGDWATALLIDGNIGIGGDPERLLARTRAVLRPGGRVLVEVEPEGAARRDGLVRLEIATDMIGWFPWSWVGVDDIAPVGRAAGLVVDGVETCDGRWFIWLRRPAGATAPTRTHASRR